jgi:hypothetical protein
MSKVTKYLLKRIASLEEELFSVKNRNSMVIGLEDELKNLNMSIEDMQDSLFSKQRLIINLEHQVEELSPKPKPESTFGHLDAFKELKEQLLKEEKEWRKKQENEDN